MSQGWNSNKTAISVNKLTEEVRHAPQPLQSIDQLALSDGGINIGLNEGDTGQYTYMGNISNTGGALNEYEDVPEGTLTPIKATFTISEYGNSTRWTKTYEDLSKLKITDSFMQALMDDMRKLQNSEAESAISATKWVANNNTSSGSIGFSTSGTASGAFNELPDHEFVRFLRKKARANNIPTYDGESYVLVSGVESMDALEFDTNIQEALKYDSGRAALNGEIGRAVGTRFVVDNHVIGALNTNYEEGYYIGGDALVRCYAEPPYIEYDEGRFRRQKAVAYLFRAAWVKTFGQDTHSREHVIKFAHA